MDPLLVQPTGGGGTTQALGGGGGCGFGSTAQQYTGTRFEYAVNGQSVTHVLGETWCWDEGSPSSAPTNYAVTWARQFLSDGARQRFRDIELDPAALTGGNLVQLARTTTTYDGDQAYFSTGTTPTGYEPGLGRIQTVNGATLTAYDHTDMLGTTRYMTDSDGQITQQAAYTAFGERVSGTANRFGYIGAHGYQSTVDTSGQEVMPYLHVGARYYDPASGRFLQRDPIGIPGGLNVYAYVESAPTTRIDPDGLVPDTNFWFPKPKPEQKPNKPSPPETPQQELRRIRRRLTWTSIGYGLCAAGTFWAPPISAAFWAGAVASGGAASLME